MCPKDAFLPAMELHLQTSGKTRVVSAIDVVEDKDHGSPPMLISVTLLDPRSLGYRPRASLSQLICWGTSWHGTEIRGRDIREMYCDVKLTDQWRGARE